MKKFAAVAAALSLSVMTMAGCAQRGTASGFLCLFAFKV